MFLSATDENIWNVLENESDLLRAAQTETLVMLGTAKSSRTSVQCGAGKELWSEMIGFPGGLHGHAAV